MAEALHVNLRLASMARGALKFVLCYVFMVILDGPCGARVLDILLHLYIS